jgi:protein SCO1/2
VRERTTPRWSRIFWWLLPAIIVLATACSATPNNEGPSETSFGSSDDLDGYNGLLLEPLEPAPDFVMEDQHGQPFRLSERGGRAVLMFFGYTNCPDVCPTTLADYVQVRENLGDRAEEMDFVFISVDADRDTPDAIVEFLGHFDPTFIGLRAEDDQALDDVKASYGVYSNALTEGDQRETERLDQYLVAHSDHSFLVDPKGQLAVLYRYATPPSEIAEDIEKVLS